MNSSLPAWNSPQKPAETTYQNLVDSILDGSLPANSTLPNEHQLSDALGVTRSTLREAMQKLSANGLIDIQHGKPTRIRDIWREGNMNTLSTILQNRNKNLGLQWIPQMLEVRIAIAPHYTYLAVNRHPEQIVQLIDEILVNLVENDHLYATSDWDLHYQLTILSENPIYTLMLNSFKDYYLHFAPYYFSLKISRETSNTFYRNLKQAADSKNAEEAANLIRQIMYQSLDLWNQAQHFVSK